MSLLDVVSELFILGSEGNSKEKIKPPKVLFIFNIFSVLGLVWLALQAKSISNLKSPILFLLLFGTIGIVFSFITMYFLWRTGLVEFFTRKFAVIIFLPLLLLTIACASTINASKNENGRLGFDLKLNEKI